MTFRMGYHFLKRACSFDSCLLFWTHFASDEKRSKFLFVLLWVFVYPGHYSFDDCQGGIELRSGGWLPECTAAVSEARIFSAERSSIEFFEEDHLIVLSCFFWRDSLSNGRVLPEEARD
jgi:hypothetical protein